MRKTSALSLTLVLLLCLALCGCGSTSDKDELHHSTAYPLSAAEYQLQAGSVDLRAAASCQCGSCRSG